MTKMADTPIYGKNPLNSSSPEPEGRWHWGLVYSIGDMGPTKFFHMTLLTSRSNLLHTEFKWEKIEKNGLMKTVEAKALFLLGWDRKIRPSRSPFVITRQAS